MAPRSAPDHNCRTRSDVRQPAPTAAGRAGRKRRTGRSSARHRTLSDSSQAQLPQCTSPEPIFDVVHFAPDPRSTSPEPITETLAGPVTSARAPPEPAIDTLAPCALRPVPSTLPEPAISISSCLALPLTVTSPEPAIDRSALSTASAPTTRLPDPALVPANFGPSTLSTVMSPEPAMLASARRGRVA